MMGKMMKTVLNKLRRDETGQAFILVLILLVLGALIIAPLLGFMSTGLIAGQLNEKRLAELYAADAGVEDALWQIMTKAAGLPQAEGQTMEYSIDDVNGKEFVGPNPITITYIDETTYKIESTATSTDADSSTTIESYVNILSLRDFMDNSITSKGPVTLQPGSQVTGDEEEGLGDVVYGVGTDPPPDDQVTDGEVRPITEGELDAWPTWDDLVLYYLQALADEGSPSLFEEGEIDIKDTPVIGPLYREGDLYIDNTKSADPFPSLTLHGTVYVTGGDLTFEQSGNKHYEVYLNGNTIFVEGAIKFPSDRCHLYGPGCIIAKGDIDFQPKLESWGETPALDFIFVMSVEETASFKPMGNFYGSIAGNVEVNLQPNCTLTWNGPPPELKYPGSDPSDMNVISAIRTWEIDQT